MLFKTLLNRSLLGGLDRAAREHLMRAPARVLRQQIGPSLLGSLWDERTYRKAIGQLFEARNEVLHSHDPTALTRARCAEFEEATSALLAAGEVALAEPRL